jgi:hypothetical protein
MTVRAKVTFLMTIPLLGIAAVPTLGSRSAPRDLRASRVVEALIPVTGAVATLIHEA